MRVGLRRGREIAGLPLGRCRTGITALVLVAAVLASALVPLHASGQRLDPAVRDRVVPAAVQVAIDVVWELDGFRLPAPIPLGSGTVVSPAGLVLTNAHVVRRTDIALTVQAYETAAREYSPDITLEFSADRFLILVSDGITPPEPAYRAVVETIDGDLDLAVLRITRAADGTALDPGLSLPFVPLADADGLRLGDPIHVFGYPDSGGDALTYTQGVVSGFNFESGIDGAAWINTDAVMSGGNSGGTAVNDAGELVGVPTQGSRLDCRPGDTNLDGSIDAEDVGCIPLGGSIGQLRPIGLAVRLLAGAGLDLGTPDQRPAETPVPAAVNLLSTPTPTPEPPEQSARADDGAQLPLVDLLPDASMLPAGLAEAGTGERSKGDVVLSLAGDDPVIEAEADQLLTDWGWEGNAFRDFGPATAKGAPSGLTNLNVSIHRFADDASADDAMIFFSDRVVAAQGLTDVAVEPLGDAARALAGAPEGNPITVLYVRDGDTMYRIGGAATAESASDPLPPLVETAKAILAR